MRRSLHEQLLQEAGLEAPEPRRRIGWKKLGAGLVGLAAAAFGLLDGARWGWEARHKPWVFVALLADGLALLLIGRFVKPAEFNHEFSDHNS